MFGHVMNIKNVGVVICITSIMLVILSWKSLSNINICTINTNISKKNKLDSSVNLISSTPSTIVNINGFFINSTDLDANDVNITHSPTTYPTNIPSSLPTNSPVQPNNTADQIKYKYYLGMMTKVKIISNIGLCRLIEWIEYNLLLGFEQIYINDDCSDEIFNISSNLDIYIKLGLVTLVPTFTNYSLNCIIDLKPNQSRNTKLMLENHVKHDCEWIANLDMDEYITFYDYNYNLKDTMKDCKFPIFRLTWWMMGSDGHETIPSGLLIEGSHYGEFNSKHIKSIAKRDEIREWSFQLFPFFKDSQRLLSNGMSLKNYTEHDDSWSFEYYQIYMNNGIYNLPKAQVFIKHYRYSSYEEFSQQKGNISITAGGVVNPWKVYRRQMWLEGNFTTMNIANIYTANKAHDVRQALKQRNLTNSIPIDKCLHYWNL